MEIPFVVECIGPTEWAAKCKDPELTLTRTNVMDATKAMADAISNWFTTTFKTNQVVQVKIPEIKAKVKATVTVRQEQPLIPVETAAPQQTQSGIKNTVDGPCAYLSDGKGITMVGQCEAQSNDIADTPGIQIDGTGDCNGKFDKCPYYKSMTSGVQVDEPEIIDDIEIEE